MAPDRKYPCTEPGCEKVFKRSEHLSRHRLNHRPKKIYHCDTCQKDFVRLDLLQRHRRRHERGMTYRNSGGYLRESNAADQTSPNALSTSNSDPSASNIPLGLTEGSEVNANQVTDIDNSLEVDRLQLPNLDYLDFLPAADFDAGHHVFSGPSQGGRGLTEDLDWLFGNLPGGNDFAEGIAMDMVVPRDFSSNSPNSTNSQQSYLDPPNTITPWYNVRTRIMSSLQSLPAEVLEESFFDPLNLKSFYDIYFNSYNPHFPILHQPSFAFQEASPLLLIAILTIGATLSPDPGHFETSEKIHQSLRWLIFSSPDFQPPAPLSCLQALLIVQAHEKMFSSRKQHEMAHIFHGAVITLMRRGSSYTYDFGNESKAIPSVERSWHQWIEKESSRRVAFFAFIMDAQHSSIFGHTPALSVSDVHLPLPCADAVWNSPNPSRWRREIAKCDETPQFLPTLRALLARRPIPATCSPFARFILLHGLFSVTKHMEARDLTASDVGTGRLSNDNPVTPRLSDASEDNWKEILDRAIDTWSFSLLSQQPSLCLEAARPLHRMAHITIHVNLIDFHVFAGAPSLTGSSVTRNEYAEAKKRIRSWSEQSIAKKTLSQCVLLIQETMFTRRQYKASEDNIALRPWCLYHATLVLWTYGIMTEGKSYEPMLGAEEYLVHMLSGLMGDLDQIHGTNRTSGLLETVRDSLSGCRWELLQEAYSTLSKLIEISSSQGE